MNKTITWKFVEKDGFPEPDNGDKTYFVAYWCGSGFGEYTKDYDDKTKSRWYLDFDSTGHEEEVTAYFEIPYYDED